MILYVVSVPIGHPDDITFRAINTFRQVDFLICEERQIGSKLLKRLDIEKELQCLNEHNEEQDVESIITRLLKGKTAAIFSDCGTPSFADPGTMLIHRCHETGIRVVPVPGASSLLAALAVAGVSLDQFYYAGFLPRQSSERRKEIRNLQNMSCPIIIYDTPYRLKALLTDLKAEIPTARQVILCLSLTKKDEKVMRGTLSEIMTLLGPKPPKKEFVLILGPLGKRKKGGKASGKKHRRKP